MTGTVALAGALGLAAAPAVSATPADPCVGQSFDTPGTYYCLVADGETVAFTIKSGDGGDGADDTGPGGLGARGMQVTGFYTNTSGAVQTMVVLVGGTGAAGGPLSPGSDGGSSAFGVLGSFNGVAEVTGGTGGAAGTDAGTGANGVEGTVTAPSPLTAGWAASAQGGDAFARFSAYAPSPEATPASVPAPHLQQFGKPSTGTCDAAAPKELDWAGVASGGWGESWAQWMNAGSGGAVCNRTLVYSPRGMWVVD